MSSRRGPRAGRACAALALTATLTVWGCGSGDGETGPDLGRARLTLAPAFAGPARVGVAAAESFRVLLTRIGGETAYDTGRRSLTSSMVTLDLPVDYTPPSELLTLEIRIFDADGLVVFRGGPIDITVGDGPEDVAIDVELRYVGVGWRATSVEITPSARTVKAGEVTTFEAVALDEDGSPIPGTPIAWSGGNDAIGLVEDPALGVVRTLRPGGLEVTARLLTGIEATARLTVEPGQGGPQVDARLVVDVESEVADARVRSDGDPPIDCYATGAGGVSGDCSGAYPPGTSVSLRAVVDDGVGAGFLRWTDGSGNTLPGCLGIDPCTLEVVADRTVSAHFIAADLRPSLTIAPAVIEPDEQASTGVTIAGRVFDEQGDRLSGAKVVFRSVGGCFRWIDPRLGDNAEAVGTSDSAGRVAVTGHACVDQPGGVRDPIVGARLAGTSSSLREYRLVVANDLPSNASIFALSETDFTVSCGEIPGAFVVAVADGRGRRLPNAPVMWGYANEFAYRTTPDGTSTSRYGEPVTCREWPHRVRATIFTEAGSKSVTFTVRVEGG